MYKDTEARNLQGAVKNIRLNREPDTCPICHRSVHPKFVTASFFGNEDAFSQAIYQCTSFKCEEYFIASYIFSSPPTTNSHLRAEYRLTKTAPVTASEADFPDTIHRLSPIFVEIYNQSIAAESENLTQLVGIGLRKALEFLVKDFAVSQNPEKSEDIKALPLAQCINKYLLDPNLKSCAKRAVWLGNDETHYTRKWEEKDIKDLKILVKLTVNWVENVLLTAQYEDEMVS